MTPKKPRIALVIFNTLTASSLWGNIVVSRLSGELTRDGIENRIFLLLMTLADEEKNRETINGFIRYLRRNKYHTVYFDQIWLPELEKRLQEEIPGINIVVNALGTLKTGRDCPALATAFSRLKEIHEPDGFFFAPSFDYIQFGEDTKLEQKIVDVVGFPCSYRKNLIRNPFYADLSPAQKNALRGCGYCTVDPSNRRFSQGFKNKMFLEQFVYFRNNLPALEKIALPSPENYFQQLLDLAPEITSGKYTPIKFFMQFRPDVLVSREKLLAAVLQAYEGTGFGIYISVVGFENFSPRELLVLNRGYTHQVIPKALKALNRLKTSFPDTLDMSDSIASFILFNPYTRVSDLKLNLDMIGRHDFTLFSNININKARINPRTGLFARADKDGLILKQNTGGEEMTDLPCGGYNDDYGYRFRDAGVGRIYTIWVEARKQLADRLERNKVHILTQIVKSF